MHQELYQFIIKESKDKFKQAYRKKFKKEEIPYTVISSISLYDQIQKNVEIISIGFGTKVLPLELCKEMKGKIVKDMHGQMLARNGFCKFIINNLPEQKKQNKYFEWDDQRLKHFLKIQYEVILYSSQNFCGDCMIDQELDIFSGAKPLKYFRLTQLPNSKFQDNILRTKPGRLDIPQHKKALSLSCSDKIGIWNILGIQGKELFNIVRPIYLDKILVEVVPETKIERVQKGIDLVKRLSILKKMSEGMIERKLFNIVIGQKQRKITKQFRINRPKIFKIQKKGQENKKGLDLAGFIVEDKLEWINGKTGLPEGVSLNSKNKNKQMKTSSVCSDKLYKGIKNEDIFKYKAVKQRIKILFGEWTSEFKQKVILQSDIHDKI